MHVPCLGAWQEDTCVCLKKQSLLVKLCVREIRESPCFSLGKRSLEWSVARIIVGCCLAVSKTGPWSKVTLTYGRGAQIQYSKLSQCLSYI